MKFEELLEGDIVDLNRIRQLRRMSDQEKYKDALRQQAGEPEEEDFFTRLSKDTPQGGEAPGWKYNPDTHEISFVDDDEDEIPFDELDMTIVDYDDKGNPIQESARLAWAKSGKKVVRKYRCTSGRRKGRIVSKPAQCTAPIDVKKRLTLKKTKARLGSKIARKARRTKRINPASKRVRRMNK